MKLKTGDNVVVISGKDKGKTGSILRVLPRTNRVVVSDVNMRTKHVKKQPNRAGQIYKYEASIDASNVMILDPKTKKRTRIGAGKDSKGRSIRVARRSGEEIKKAIKPVTAKDEKATAKSEEKEAPKAKKAAPKTKAAKATKEKKVESTEAPKKSPFWKRSKKEDASDAEVEKESHMNEDHSVAEQGQTPDSFTHERGN